MAQSVDIVIRAKDEASVKFGLVGNNFSKLMVRFGSAMYAVRLMSGLADAVADLHKMYREGRVSADGFAYAILNHIPILGSVTKSFQEMTKEIGGLNAAMERSVKIDKVLVSITKLNQQLSDSITKSKYSEKEQPKIDAWLKYRDVMKEIDTIEKEQRAAGGSINIDLMRKKANQVYLNALEEIRKKREQEGVDFLTKARIKSQNELLAFAKDARKAIETPFEKISEMTMNVQMAIKAGLLSAAEGAKYLDKYKKDIMGEPKNKMGEIIERKISMPEERFLTLGTGARFNSTERNTENTAKNTSRTNKLLENTNKELIRLNTTIKTVGGTTIPLTNWN